MLFRSTILFTIALAFILSSCAPQHADLVVAKFGDNQIKMKEFEDSYAKNVGSIEAAKKDSLSKLKNFLDLYLNFKMKLRDAEVRGYGDDPALKQELTDYKKKVGVTYLLEKNIVEPGIKDLYDKRKWELRVSHLMIRPDSTGEEAARKHTQAILDSIKSGKSFEEMVSKYTQDSFSKQSGGDIFYVTAGQLPVEFEDAAYNTPVGQVYPSVVRTKYGFHIIKVTEKRERVPQIRASHILISFNNSKGVADTAFAKAKLDSVLRALKSGEDFGKVAMRYSDDTGSKQQGGDLNYFERRMMVKEFDEAAFNLNVGQVSGVVKTTFGYHIIKVTDKKPYPPFEDEKENLKKIFKQSRYQGEYDTLIAHLKVKYNFKVNDNNLNYLVTRSDSVKIGGDHPKMDEIKNVEVLSYAGTTVNFQDFFTKLNGSNDYLNKLITLDLLKGAANKFGADYLLDEEALNLEKTNSEFASLMEDYRNGIFIFKLQDDEVWSKINFDSTKLFNYYASTKNNYVFPDRINFSEIFTHKDSLIKNYYNLLKKGDDFDSIASKYTERPGYAEKAGNYGLVEINNSALSQEANKLKNSGDYSNPFSNADGYSIVKLVTKEPSRIKSFEEAKAEVSGAFQESESKRLEQEYIDQLKSKYKPVIHYDILEQAFKD
ncbi:MAG: peptidylprolyl isomerase [Ignavibacteriaceae bacterium]|nr:peptidylprolyl isomerase [Ignavibacteriaceae bacterium]